LIKSIANRFARGSTKKAVGKAMTQEQSQDLIQWLSSQWISLRLCNVLTKEITPLMMNV